MNKPSLNGIKNHLKKRAKLLALVSTVTLAPHLYFHEEVKQSVNAQGQSTYSHSDPETDRILRYLSGQEKLNPTERRALAFSTYKARLICSAARNENSQLPDDFIAMNEDQVIDLLQQNSLKTRQQISEDFRSELAQMINNIPEQHPENPDLHKQLWELEKIAGAPQIRWTTEHTLPLGERTLAHYKRLPSTLFITPVTDKNDNPYDDFVAEAAHAIQFQDLSPEPYARLFSTLIHSTLSTAQSEKPFLKSSFNHAYGKEYTRPGSIEYQAHSEIEPALFELFPALSQAANPKD